jgi:polysaccharide export outer membrane protein
MRKIIAFLLLSIIFTSCIPLKEQVYFQGNPTESDTIRKIQDEPYRLQVNDLLDIQIKSSDEKLVALFSSTPSVTTGNSTLYSEETLYFRGYTIDKHGNIRLPYLGEINVLGYTTNEVLEKLQKEFETYFKNPEDVFITVKLAGVRFTIIGEVGQTGTMVLYLNQVNLVQALAAAGDIKITGNREKVRVFRKNIDGTTEYNVNMLDINSFDSDNFFVQSNDIIYVEPLKQKSWGTGTSGMQTISSLIAVLSLITTTILLVNAL